MKLKLTDLPRSERNQYDKPIGRGSTTIAFESEEDGYVDLFTMDMLKADFYGDNIGIGLSKWHDDVGEVDGFAIYKIRVPKLYKPVKTLQLKKEVQWLWDLRVKTRNWNKHRKFHNEAFWIACQELVSEDYEPIGTDMPVWFIPAIEFVCKWYGVMDVCYDGWGKSLENIMQDSNGTIYPYDLIVSQNVIDWIHEKK